MNLIQFERNSNILSFEKFEKDKMIILKEIGLLACTCLVDFSQN
jgi:hypothetical protein